MKINKILSQQQVSNSTFKVSIPPLLRGIKKILDEAIKTPIPSSKKNYSSERVCRDLKDLFKPFISH